ncbi:cellulose synthase/poly-beta-1,6-N-acetylglucosamine synthase-like glycosyltransferase [Gillisia mitskevichiae]|uniref:Cellulose synthase/poly-beta-1,6-N-acetylglucosamine synthase-like glycosyltransferase n=1 Tax=Gillisia mitskevichiae TaxID=270921 RepID=A0A495PM35_9FLAO|nr:glycosyltransferase [Gillisia mitskevichiae]RKS50755.1 cellulose synthase/poly-beta-1,6-N-acetylglucosamine synthase-like glycosyltransferase [Gillisia mitskevichiae]
MQLEYSFIIPVYNRPDEIRELLESMQDLDFNGHFEIVIVEDGSSISSEEVIEDFKGKLNISYYYKENTGPGDSRNYGMKLAKGNYFLILDSDVLLPKNYLFEVDTFLSSNYYDCFGGPDAAHESFTDLQKAINYSMTSLLTTGGIRGNKQAVNKFQPRSFNMGLSKKAFVESGGFGLIHPGEDPDLALRLLKEGFETILIPNAIVFHKRRIDWNKFYTQVNKFGMVRPILNSWHPQSAKITFWFPTLFISGFALAIIFWMLGFSFFIWFYLFYFLIIGIDAGIKNKSGYIGIAAIMATFIQFLGYGVGFLNAIWKLKFLKMQPQEAFPKLFFTNED